MTEPVYKKEKRIQVLCTSLLTGTDMFKFEKAWMTINISMINSWLQGCTLLSIIDRHPKRGELCNQLLITADLRPPLSFRPIINVLNFPRVLDSLSVIKILLFTRYNPRFHWFAHLSRCCTLVERVITASLRCHRAIIAPSD